MIVERRVLLPRLASVHRAKKTAGIDAAEKQAFLRRPAGLDPPELRDRLPRVFGKLGAALPFLPGRTEVARNRDLVPEPGVVARGVKRPRPRIDGCVIDVLPVEEGPFEVPAVAVLR